MGILNFWHVTERDAELLYELAKQCPPLDMHTPYTYWVICKYFANQSFVLVLDGQPIGYIMAIQTNDCMFLWQIGIKSDFRGRGYSQFLIDIVVTQANQLHLPVQTTIDINNVASYRAMAKYCGTQGLVFNQIGVCAPSGCHAEILYEMKPV